MDDVHQWLIPDSDLYAKCHYTSGSSYGTDVIFTAAGYYGEAIFRTVKNMYESGILLMYQDYTKFVTDAKFDRILKLREYMENTPVPFKMADAPIISIFLGLIAVLGISGVIFLGEYFNRCIKEGVVGSLRGHASSAFKMLGVACRPSNSFVQRFDTGSV